MAGDWIKMRVDLQSHPKVVRILSATKSDKFRVIGGLHAVWAVFDAHSVDGVLPGYSPETMDHVIGWHGFSKAMIAVGWLQCEGEETLVMPEFGEHNGKSAKRRAENSKSKRDTRNRQQPVDNTCGQNADKVSTREEKRREEEKQKKDAPPARTSRKLNFSDWVKAVKAKGEKPIPAGDPLFAWAEEADIPTEFLLLAWRAFEDKHLDSGKRYVDWRATFRNAVKGNWMKIWFFEPSGDCRLTTVGIQWQRSQRSEAAA